MILGIDASNIRSGGGLTHIVNLLKVADPLIYGISKVIVWSNQATLNKIEDRLWLVKSYQPLLEKNLLYRSFWQRVYLSKIAQKENCNVLFVPGGSYAGNFHPVVTMCRNMLPFEPREAARFGRFSPMRLKMWLLRHSQSYAFKRADGVIFLTSYAKSTISKLLGGLFCCTQAIIPHGIEQRFIQPPRDQRQPPSYSLKQPFRVLYVSILMPYKHQIEVAIAASYLRSDGIPIEVRFVGVPWGDYGRQFRALLEDLDPMDEYLLWTGGEAYEDLHRSYKNADAFVFASSCENLPNILIEAMAAGLPIACANRGPMPEILGEAGIYFDPDVPESIAQSLRQLSSDIELRTNLADMVWKKAKNYSWQDCSHETFAFIAKIFNQDQDDTLKNK